MPDGLARRQILGLFAAAATAGCGQLSDRGPAATTTTDTTDPTTHDDATPTEQDDPMKDISAVYDSIIREPTKDDLPSPPETTPAFAVTNGGVYEWHDGESEWRQTPLGTPEEPLPQTFPTQERVKERTVYGHQLEDFAAGRVGAMEYASWPMQMHDSLASYPVNKTRPVLMFHSEGTYPVEYEKTFPRMKERGLPWMMAATPNRVGSGISREKLMEMLIHGCEIGLYTGADGNLEEHVDDIDDLEWILLEQKRQLEEMGFPVQHMQPRKGTGVNTDEIDEPKSYMTRSAYAASGHGYAEPESNGPTAVGNVANHGHASVKIEDGDQTAAEAKRIIDRLVKTNDRLRFFFHSHKIKDWGRMDEILDYAAKKRRQGELDIATSTGGVLIPWDLPDGDLVNDDGSFADSFEEGLWSPYGAPPKVRTDGGSPSNTNYWAMGTGPTGASLSGIYEQKITLNPQFPAGMVDFYARAPPGHGEVTVMADSFRTEGLKDKEFETTRTVGDSWTRMFVPFGSPRNDAGSGRAGGWRLALYTESQEVHVDDLRIYPC